jgi:hypothetical protein
MNVNYKRSIKFITLLIISLLIATVSAATYKYMFIDGSVIIGTQELVWIQDGSEVSGDTVTVDLNVEPDIPADFNETLYLKNKDITDHNLTMTVTTSVSTDTFEYSYVYIYENFTIPGTWQLVDNLDLTQPDDEYSTYTGNNPLESSSYYKLDFGIKAKTGTTGTHVFDIKVKYEE